jgi:hypothetical protein
MQLIFPNTRLPVPGWQSSRSVGGEASRAAEEPSRASDHGQGHDDKPLWRCQTACVLACVTVFGEPVSYIFLLLMNVTDLEPNIFLGKWPRRIVNDVLEALKKTVSQKIS